MKKVFIILLSCIIVFSTVSSFEVANATEKSDLEHCQELIDSIEYELGMKGTSIDKELIKLTNTIKQDLKGFVNEEYKNALEFCEETEFVLAKYQEIKRGTRQMLDDNTYYLAAVGAVQAWFSSHGYTLASELLGHALSNTVLNSGYHPAYGYKVDYSTTYNNIRYNNTNSYGTASFEAGSTTNDNDLYYAIHAFGWFRLTPTRITLSDVYDYSGNDKNYGSIAGVAVFTMYTAQELGILTPYVVHIDRP